MLQGYFCRPHRRILIIDDNKNLLCPLDGMTPTYMTPPKNQPFCHSFTHSVIGRPTKPTSGGRGCVLFAPRYVCPSSVRFTNNTKLNWWVADNDSKANDVHHRPCIFAAFYSPYTHVCSQVRDTYINVFHRHPYPSLIQLLGVHLCISYISPLMDCCGIHGTIYRFSCYSHSVSNRHLIRSPLLQSSHSMRIPKQIGA